MQKQIMQEVSMQPEHVAQIKKQVKQNTYIQILGIAGCFIGTMGVLHVLGLFGTFVPIDTTIRDIWIALVILVAGVLGIAVAKSRITILQRDVAEQLVQVIQTPLRRKNHDKKDAEYELYFEGVYNDVDVRKDSFDRATEGTVYELLVAKHSQHIFAVRDLTTGQALDIVEK